MRLVTEEEARTMRCTEFVLPFRCAGTRCHKFQFVQAIRIETGESVTGADAFGDDVTRFHACTASASHVAIQPVKVTDPNEVPADAAE